jgi:hypothetical protein
MGTGEITRTLVNDKWIYQVDVSDIPWNKVHKYMENVRELAKLYTELKDEDISPHTNS